MRRTLRIYSPDCESDECFCPYLDPASGSCWGVDDEQTQEGCPRQCVDGGEGMMPRWSRHVECPFGTMVAVVRLSRERKLEVKA